LSTSRRDHFRRYLARGHAAVSVAASQAAAGRLNVSPSPLNRRAGRRLLSSSFPLPPSTFTSPAKLIATAPPPPNCLHAQHRLILALRLNPLVPPLSTAISRARHFCRNESAMTTVT
jgi:hypothetical protein